MAAVVGARESVPQRGAIWVGAREGLVAIDPETGEERQVRRARGVYAADWNRDGNRVVFARFERNQTHLYVARHDWTAARRIASGDILSFALAPDGTRVAYEERTPAGGGPDAVTELHIVAADGSSVARFRYPDGYDRWPDWSADGELLVYGDDRGLMLMRADGTAERRLLRGRYVQPTWSPDGRWIAFHDGLDIFIVRPSGGPPRRLTGNTTEDEFPTWAPDSKHIAYWSRPGGPGCCTAHDPYAVWILNVESGRRRQLTPLGYGLPMWGHAP